MVFYLNANVQRVKRDIFTVNVYHYVTIAFDYAKRGSRFQHMPIDVVLQRFEFIKACMGKSVR